tara:strand:+ start:104 stop:466 length:363 start_codon:yes stop_codon:yes gene_type:complete
MAFNANLGEWLRFEIDREKLEKEISWKDFGTGVKLGKIHRKDGSSLVVYDCDEVVSENAFVAHTHKGGEVYLVLEGEVVDSSGSFSEGSIVWLPPGSKHLPKTVGKTLILVLWPNGVQTI